MPTTTLENNDNSANMNAQLKNAFPKDVNLNDDDGCRDRWLVGWLVVKQMQMVVPMLLMAGNKVANTYMETLEITNV